MEKGDEERKRGMGLLLGPGALTALLPDSLRPIFFVAFRFTHQTVKESPG